MSVTWDDVGTPTIRRGEDSIEITPEKLKKRYNNREDPNATSRSIELNRTYSGTSPIKRKALDYISQMENDTNEHWEKSQVDYLKKVILTLDAKCKVTFTSLLEC